MHVLCITPNVAVDRTLRVPGFRPGGVWRAAETTAVCGGKGVNVARAVFRLGHFATCAGILGGDTGRLAAARAEAEGLEAVWTRADGETRTCVIIADDNGETTVINEPGPAVSRGTWARFEHDAQRAAAHAAVVCVAGSVPPGCLPGGMFGLVAALSGEAAALWVDTSGEALAEAIEAGAGGIKINGAEASALLGRSIITAVGAASAALEIRRRGVDSVAITLGADGAVFANANGVWRSRPPAIKVVNAVGSGDTFLAGLVIALAEGDPPQEALRRATAAGTANAATPEAGDFDPDTFERLLRATVVEPIRM